MNARYLLYAVGFLWCLCWIIRQFPTPIEEAPDVRVRVVSKHEILEVLQRQVRWLIDESNVASKTNKPAVGDTNTLHVTITGIWDKEYGSYRCLKNGTWIQLMEKR